MFSQALVLVILSTLAIADRSEFLQKTQHLINTTNLTSKCLQALDDMGKDAMITMLDASGRIPTGIEYGNIFDLGHFDECYNLETHKPQSFGNITLYGKYCLGYLLLPTDIPQYLELNVFNISTKFRKMKTWVPERGIPKRAAHLGLRIGVCVPDQCSAKELSGNLHLSEYSCYSKATAQLSLDRNAVVAVSILSIFGLIVVVSTLLDVFLYCKQQKIPHDMLVAFSLLSNGKKLLSTSSNPDQILCINGIKAMSMMWVVLGHMYFQIMFLPATNLLYVKEWVNDAASMFVLSGLLSVDSFLVVGGLVAVYTFMKTMNEASLNKFNIPLFYLHRYLRLTPAFAAVVLISATLVKYMGNGPLWSRVDRDFGEYCREYWWSALLYIQNYVNINEQCFPQSWYLNLDMQMFVLLPLILVPLRSWPNLTLFLLYILSVVGAVVPFAVAFSQKFAAFEILGGGTFWEWSNRYYYQVYTRFGPYVIGMICGYYCHKLKTSKRKPELHWVLVSILWPLILSGMLACVYAGHEFVSSPDDRLGNALYIGFHRCAWAVGLSGIIYLCTAGYGGPINSLLSASVFQFFSKISYSMFLVHVHIINIWNSSRKTTFKFSNIQFLMDFWGIFMISVVCATVLCLVFESPVIIIEKCIFGRGAKGPQLKPDENEAETEES